MANGDGKAPVAAAIRAGVTFVRENIAALVPAAALTLTINLALGVLLASSPALLLTSMIGVSVVFQAFILRLAIHNDRSGVLGLKLGMDELRLLAVVGAALLVMLVFVLGGAIVLTSAATITASQSGIDLSKITDRAEMDAIMKAELSGPHGLFIWATFGLLFAVIVYIFARFAVAPAATIGERRLLIFSTYPWTRGNALRIVAALAPFGIVAVCISALATSLATMGPVGMALQLIIAFTLSVTAGAAQVAVTAFLYRGFRPPELGRPPGSPSA